MTKCSFSASVTSTSALSCSPRRTSYRWLNERAIRSMALLVGVMLFSGSPYVQASPDTWQGPGSNFSTGFASTPATGSTLVFASPGSAPITVTDDISSLTVGGSNADGIDFGTSAAAYTISGSNTLTLNSSGTGVGISDLAQSGPALSGQTLSVPLVLGSTQTINVASLGSLTLSGVISGSGFGITKTGSGLLTLSSTSNSFSGPIDVTGGTLSVASDTNLGATSGSIILDGGALRITGTTVTVSSTRGISLGDSGASTGGTIDVSSSADIYDGVLANNGGTNSLTKTGLGQLTLGNTETYTGSTYINQGTLVLDFSQLSAPSTNILNSGGAVVLGGTVTALNPETTGGPSIPTLKVVGSTSANSSQTIASLTLNPGANFVTVAAGSGHSAVLNLGAITQNLGGQVDFTLPTGTQSSTNGITTTSANSTNGGSGTGILGGWAVVGGATATAYATSAGTGSVAGNITAYTGYTAITTGAITSNAATNYQVQSGTQALTVASGTTDINTLSNSSTTAGISTVTIATGGILRLGSQGGMMIASGATGELEIEGAGTLTAGGAANTAGEISILDFGTNGTTDGNGTVGVYIDSLIANNVTGGVVTLTVGQPGGSGSNAAELGIFANTYSGGTYVNSGRLRVDGSQSLGTGAVTIAPGAQVGFASAATPTNNFNIAGYGTSASSVALALGTSGSLGTSSTAATITLLGDSDFSAGGAVTIYDKITGGYSMTFGPGPGALGGSTGMVVTLSNANNNYMGNTIISEGTLKMGAQNVIPNGTGYGDVILTNAVSGNSTLDLGGFSQTINGLTSVSGTGGTGVVTNSSATAVTLTLGNGDQSGNFVGSITNTGTLSLVKEGAGTETLSGASTYSGTTTVNGGTLLVNNTSASTSSGVGTGAVQVNTGGTLSGTGSIGTTTTNNTVTIGNGGTLSPGASGAGALTFNLSGSSVLALNSGSTLALTLGTSSTSVAFNTNGNWLAGSSGNATLSLTEGTGFSYANTYTVFSNVDTTGFTFASITGYDTTDYTAAVTLTGGDAYDLTFSAAPEPSTWAMMFGGLAFLVFRARGRNRRVV